jgi:hypothetical protein
METHAYYSERRMVCFGSHSQLAGRARHIPLVGIDQKIPCGNESRQDTLRDMLVLKSRLAMADRYGLVRLLTADWPPHWLPGRPRKEQIAS